MRALAESYIDSRGADFRQRTKPHDLRRTCTTGASRLSNPIVASKILGHTATPGVPSVTAIYDRYDRLPEKVATITAWGAFVERLVSDDRRARVVPLARG